MSKKESTAPKVDATSPHTEGKSTTVGNRTKTSYPFSRDDLAKTLDLKGHLFNVTLTREGVVFWCETITE